MIASTSIAHEIGRALSFAAGMTWEILWALILGFTLSGVVQAVVSKRDVRRAELWRTKYQGAGAGGSSTRTPGASLLRP